MLTPAAARAAVARASKSRDPKRIADARQTLTFVTAERAIQTALTSAFPLSADQRRRLAQLLTGGGK